MIVNQLFNNTGINSSVLWKTIHISPTLAWKHEGDNKGRFSHQSFFMSRIIVIIGITLIFWRELYFQKISWTWGYYFSHSRRRRDVRVINDWFWGVGVLLLSRHCDSVSAVGGIDLLGSLRGQEHGRLMAWPATPKPPPCYAPHRLIKGHVTVSPTTKLFIY